MSSKINLNDFLDIISNSINNNEELISYTLQKISKIDGHVCTAICLLNNITFDFDIIKTEPQSYNEHSQQLFEKLISNNIIEKVFETNEIVEWNNEEISNIYIIPLQNKGKLEGLIIINLNNNFSLSQKIKDELNLLIKIFGLIYFNVQTQNEQINNNSNELLITLNETVKNLYKIFNTINEGIVLTNLNNIVIDLNNAASKLLGIPKDEILGKDIRDYLLFLDKKLFKEEIVNNEEAILINSEGSPIPILFHSQKIKVDNIEYNEITIIDITERKLMEDKILEAKYELENKVKIRTQELYALTKQLKDAIHKKEEAQKDNLKLITAINQSNSLVFILDTNLNIQYVNESVLNKTNYDVKELIGKSVLELNCKEQYSENILKLKKRIIEESQSSSELNLISKKGKVFWVWASFAPVKNSEGETINYISIQEDITRIKEYQEELIKAKEQVEKSLNAKTILLNKISHEFRTPLVSILGFSEMLEYEINDHELIEMVFGIKEGGNRLLTSLDSVLLFSELESSTVNLNINKFNIVPIINKIIDYNLQKVNLKGIRIINEIEDEQIALVDKDYFKVIIHHLVDNAIKFTLKGEIKIFSNIYKESEKSFIKISVKDTGIGIKEEDMNYLFDAFKQISEGTNRNFDGFGLGLSLVKRMTEMMNGKIEVESKLNQGSTFSVIFETIN
ncbi:MAG: PAS domain-containing sensor histidine kinase [Melioribacteraceae bacterium]|nr:PAS domain-containing sensor histidine kinase [Melioribacteraceae bacterium]